MLLLLERRVEGHLRLESVLQPAQRNMCGIRVKNWSGARVRGLRVSYHVRGVPPIKLQQLLLECVVRRVRLHLLQLLLLLKAANVPADVIRVVVQQVLLLQLQRRSAGGHGGTLAQHRAPPLQEGWF